MSTFDYFLNLPQELQADILSTTVSTLKQSQLLNKSISSNLHLLQKFYKHFCDLPTSNQEMHAYLNNTLPHKMLFFSNSCTEIQEFRSCDNINNYKYKNIDIDTAINYNDNDISARINELRLNYYDIDLFHMYHIYKLRYCETIKPGYSKLKILAYLNTFYNTRKGESYKDLVFIFLYLRGNLQQFNQSVPKNEYKYYIISNKENVTYGKDRLTVDELKHKIDQQCQEMYQQLLTTINNLD